MFLQFCNLIAPRALVYDVSPEMDFRYTEAAGRNCRPLLICAGGFYNAARPSYPCLSGICDIRIPEPPVVITEFYFLQLRNLITSRALVYDVSAKMAFGYKQVHRRQCRRWLICARGFYSVARPRPHVFRPRAIPVFRSPPAEITYLYFLQLCNLIASRSLVYDASALMHFGYKQARRRHFRRRLFPDRVFYSVARPRPPISFGAMRYIDSRVPRRNDIHQHYKFKRDQI